MKSSFTIVIALLAASLISRAAPGSAANELQSGLNAAEVYNWAAAALHFKAAQSLASVTDRRTAVMARIGYMRATMEQRNLAVLSREFESLSPDRIVRSDPEVRMWLYIGKGDCDNDLQFPEIARRDWQLVKELARETHNSKWLYRADGELAIPAYYLGDLATSRKLVTQALTAAAVANDVASEVRLLTHIGTVYIMRDQFAPGMEHLNKAEQLANSKPEIGYPVTVKEGQVLGLIGMGNFPEAQKLATEVISRMHAQDRRINETQTRVMLATIYQLENNIPAAIHELEIAIQMSAAGNYYHSLADAQMRLSKIYIQQGRISEAEKCVSQALESTHNSGIVSDLPTQMEVLASLKTQEGKYTEADSLYRKAEDEVDSQLRLTPVFAKSLLLKSTSDIYTEHFDLLAEHAPNVAAEYNIVERVRGRILADLLHTAPLVTSAEDTSAEHDISQLRLRLADARTAQQIARARENIFFVRHERWLDTELEPNRSLRTQAETVLPISVVQKNLDAAEVLIEFVVTQANVYAFVITSNSARLQRLGKRREIDDAVKGFTNAVYAKETAVGEGTRLHTLLFQPISELNQHRWLIVIPDGALHAVPFAALVVNGKRLIETHVIVRAPSASTYVLLRRRESSAVDEGLLAVSGIRYNADLYRIASLRGYNGSLDNLPGSQEEAEAATEILGPVLQHALLLDDKAATETAVKEALQEKRAVVHLAVHGLVQANNDPEMAALLFLPDPKSDEDGMLEVPEIVRLPLGSDLVVLSACNTAVGDVQGEEGVSNLSRAFLLAGARTVISTLWSIDDSFSATLMRHFYESLAKGEPKSDALVEAQRYVLTHFSQTAVPWYWAGYIIEGDATTPLTKFQPDRRALTQKQRIQLPGASTSPNRGVIGTR